MFSELSSSPLIQWHVLIQGWQIITTTAAIWPLIYIQFKVHKLGAGAPFFQSSFKVKIKMKTGIVSNISGKCSYGGIMWSSEANWLGGFYSSLGSCNSLEAEIHAFFVGLKELKSRNELKEM